MYIYIYVYICIRAYTHARRLCRSCAMTQRKCTRKRKRGEGGGETHTQTHTDTDTRNTGCGLRTRYEPRTLLKWTKRIQYMYIHTYYLLPHPHLSIHKIWIYPTYIYTSIIYIYIHVYPYIYIHFYLHIHLLHLHPICIYIHSQHLVQYMHTQPPPWIHSQHLSIYLPSTSKSTFSLISTSTSICIPIIDIKIHI